MILKDMNISIQIDPPPSKQRNSMWRSNCVRSEPANLQLILREDRSFSFDFDFPLKSHQVDASLFSSISTLFFIVPLKWISLFSWNDLNLIWISILLQIDIYQTGVQPLLDSHLRAATWPASLLDRLYLLYFAYENLMPLDPNRN